MNDALDNLKKAVDDFSEHLYQLTKIFIMNPEDIMRLDLNDFSNNTFIISVSSVAPGQAYAIQDSPLKRQLYEFIEKHPDRVFRGKRCEDDI